MRCWDLEDTVSPRRPGGASEPAQFPICIHQATNHIRANSINTAGEIAISTSPPRAAPAWSGAGRITSAARRAIPPTPPTSPDTDGLKRQAYTNCSRSAWSLQGEHAIGAHCACVDPGGVLLRFAQIDRESKADFGRPFASGRVARLGVGSQSRPYDHGGAAPVAAPTQTHPY